MCKPQPEAGGRAGAATVPSFILPNAPHSTALVTFGDYGFPFFSTTDNEYDGCCTPRHRALDAFPQHPASFSPSNLLEAHWLRSASKLTASSKHFVGEDTSCSSQFCWEEGESRTKACGTAKGFLQTPYRALCALTPYLASLWKAQGSTSCQKKHPAHHSMLWSYAIPVPTMHRWARDHLQAWSPAPDLIRGPVQWHRACSGCGKGACTCANATGRGVHSTSPQQPLIPKSFPSHWMHSWKKPSTSANQRAASNRHSGALAGTVQDTYRLTLGTLQSPRNPWIPQFKCEEWYQLHKAAPIFQTYLNLPPNLTCLKDDWSQHHQGTHPSTSHKSTRTPPAPLPKPDQTWTSPIYY